MKSYKLITFDVTGTLLKFRKVQGVQYAEIARNVGIRADPDLLNEQFKIQWNLTCIKYPNYGLNSDIHFKKWWKILIKNTFNGCNVTEDQLERLSNNLIQAYGKRDCWELNNGVEDVLNTIKKYDTKIGIISNFDPSLDALLKEMGIHKYFDFIISSYNVGLSKPDSRIFQLAREKYQICSGNALHIGDNLYLDYKAALDAGWDAYLLYEDDKFILAEQYPFVNVNHVFTDLRAVRQTLFKNRLFGSLFFEKIRIRRKKCYAD